jgi:hypothetical protein
MEMEELVRASFQKDLILYECDFKIEHNLLTGCLKLKKRGREGQRGS